MTSQTHLKPLTIEEQVINEHGQAMALCACGNMCKVSDIEAQKAIQEKNIHNNEEDTSPKDSNNT